MFSNQNLREEVEEFVKEYMKKQVGSDRLIYIQTRKGIEKEDLNLTIIVKDLTKEEKFRISKELHDIFWNENLDIPLTIDSQKYLKKDYFEYLQKQKQVSAIYY